MSNKEQAGSFPECTPEQQERMRSLAEPALAAAGHEPGDRIAVVIDNEIRMYTYRGEANATGGEPFPNCPVEVCRQMQPLIHKYCLDLHAHSGYPIAIIWEDRICYCYCK